MSAGSSNIVVQITDRVDAGIAPKIRDIAAAALQANTNLLTLQAAINGVTGGTGNLRAALGSLQPAVTATVAVTGRLEGAFAQLLGRVVGAEAGFGMLGGAMARVGVAAGVAGPLIIAALAIGAIVGAILIYNKFEEAARKLIIAQTELNEHTASLNDKHLQMRETLIGLTQGPLAKYQAELDDLSKKTIPDNLSQINKVLDDQKSKWATIVSFVERYQNSIISASLGLPLFFAATSKSFGVQDAQDFLNNSKEQRSQMEAEGKSLQGLQDELKRTGAKLVELHNLEQTESGRTLANTEVARKAIQARNNELLLEQRNYNDEQRALQQGKDGQYLADRRKAAEEELRIFHDKLNALKENADGVVSPQRQLALIQQERAKFLAEHPDATNQKSPNAGVLDELNKEAGIRAQSIQRETNSLEQLIKKLRDTSVAEGDYTLAMKVQTAQQVEADKIRKLAPDNANTDKVVAISNSIVKAKIMDSEMNKALATTYDNLKGPIERYQAALSAISIIKARHEMDDRQAAIATAAATRTLQDAINPLNTYAIGLQSEVSLWGKYGSALAAATEVERLDQSLKVRGIALTADQSAKLTDLITKINLQKAIEMEVNTLYSQNAGQVEKLTIQEKALNQAVQQNVITLGQYRTGMLAATLAQNQLLNERGFGDFRTHVLQALGDITKGFTSFADGATKTFGQFFVSLNKGLGDSIAQFLVFNKSLSQSLLDLARNAVAQLISSLIQLGIQYVLVTELEKAFHINLPKSGDATKETIKNAIAAVTAIALITSAELASITALQGPAWSLAEAMSLLSFGANAAGAVSGIAAVVAAGTAAEGHWSGGMVGGMGGIDRVSARLTRGEYVVNAGATSRNLDTLQNINSGGSGSGIKVNVIHDGSTRIQVVKTTDNEIRIIAKQEAQAAVQTHGPSVIAADLQNPNSRTSKAINQNVDVKRRR